MATYQPPQQGPPLDAQPTLDATPVRAPDPFADLRLASQNYWAGRTGLENPPAPTLRMIRGRKMLGRYMDPYGCQCHLRAQRNLWEKWYTSFFITAVIILVSGPETDFLSLAIIGPIYAAYYFWNKAKHTRQYKMYYAVQDEILRTGEPEWVPYDKVRLKMLDRQPMAVWP
jgi:hypothetical protein